MDAVKLNEEFAKLIGDNKVLKESVGKDPMPKVTYEKVPGAPATKPTQVHDANNANASTPDDKNMQKVGTNVAKNQKVVKVGGGDNKNPSGPDDYVQKAASPISGSSANDKGHDPMPTVPVNVAYGNKVIFKSNYTMNKESFDVASDINSLFEGSEMSEELKTKAAVIFEAVIKDKLNEEIEGVKKELSEQYTKAFHENINNLSESVDQSVQYGITKWIDDNALSITNSIQSQITQDFMTDLKKVFEMHNINIPENKNDLVEEMAEKIDELTKKLDEEIENNMKMKKKMDEKDKEDTVKKVSEGLSEMQKDKLQKLSETFIYKSNEEFETRLNTLKEFITRNKSNNQVLTEGVNKNDTPESTPDSNNKGIMDYYTEQGWV